uniref:Candidate secreted effector n=1 Tax=Meloidogyne incognita TaxID=6306 RepID=A0A914P343_MELIC
MLKRLSLHPSKYRFLLTLPQAISASVSICTSFVQYSANASSKLNCWWHSSI